MEGRNISAIGPTPLIASLPAGPFALRRGGLDGLDYMMVARTAAEHPGDRFTNLFFRGVRILLEEFRGADKHAGGAEAALQSVVFPVRLLEFVELTVLRQPLHRYDLQTVRLNGEHQAGSHALARDLHGAGAADSVLAADVRPG